jgi:hypothetical protein
MRYNAEESQEAQPGQVQCPYCHSTNIEPFSLFGQQLLTVQMYCNSCHTPFECVKDDALLERFTTRKENQA